MKLKSVDLVTVIIWAVASAIWVVKLVRLAMSGSAGPAGYNIFLALLWVASFCVVLYRYWKGRKGKE